ncbi:MAG: DUF11 domain-containing protein [Planctomycetota bacterium]|nr:DUF11 domain-containing protein [Planctomycetota bacterium]
MTVHAKTQTRLLAALILTTALMGCRNHMPHSATWAASGDTVQSHPKPPEGGYYTNWDPFAVKLEVFPKEDKNPIRTQHVLVATVRDADGKPLPNRRVEWMLAEGGVGDIVEVDESGWRASRGYKVTNHFAVSHTNNFDHVLDLGNDDPADDVHLTTGQTWCVITSPVVGTSFITAYAPGIYDWNHHKVFVVKHWYEGAPEIKLEKSCPSEVMICDPITYDIVVRNTGDMRATNVKITDQLPDGLTTERGGSAISINVGDLGPGKSRRFTYSARASKTGSFSNTAVATGDEGLRAEAGSQVVVRKPALVVTKKGPAMRYLGRPAKFEITVANQGDAPARNTVLVDSRDGGKVKEVGDGGRSAGGKVTWTLGTIEPGASRTVSLTIKPTRIGTLRNTATATAYCAEASASAEMKVEGIPAILLECVDNPDPIEIDGNVTYTITVTNQGSAVGTNIAIVCTLPKEQEHVSSTGPTKAVSKGKKVTFAPLATLAPKASVVYKVTVKGIAEGDVRFKVSLNSDQMTSPAEETESTRIY